MNAQLIWDGKMGFTASGDTGHAVKVDVDTEVGGSDSGARPMEFLLFGLGGCSGADVVSIMRKMQQGLEKLTISISTERASEDPKRFTDIHMIYRMNGKNLDAERAKHAIELSLTKYCSAAGSLNAKITSELVIE
jgi:Predicted redox protein, regulator of disulfide bond formation